MKRSLLFLFSITLGMLIFMHQGVAQVSVTATAGITEPTSYTTVNAAFAAINTGTHQGDVTISITGNTTEPATPIPLLKSSGTSSYTSVLIKPTGGDWTINSAATPTASKGVIELSGADNVTIDGDPENTGSRHLSIVVATTTTAGTAAVRFSSNSTTGLDGADNCTIKNCNITGGRSSATSTTTSYGFVMSNASSISTGAYKSINTLVENNLITRCYHGIYANGASASYLNSGIQILNNVIGSDISELNIGNRGIRIAYSASVEGTGSAIISGNDIQVGTYGSTGYAATIAGIEIGTVNAGCIVSRNNIHDINQPTTSGYGAQGILISGSASNGGIDINNNFIRDCKMVVYQTSATSTFIPSGIRFTAGATNVKINYNTISMGTQLGTGVNYSSYGVNAAVSTVTIAEFQNNIIVNTHASTYAFGLYCANTANISGGTVNYNDYYCPNGNVGYYNAGVRTTLLDWQTATSKDGNSISADPGFSSATDLHINVGATAVNNMGTPLASITIDYDGEARSEETPDIGADEYTPLVCSGFEGGTISPETASRCAGQTYTMSTAGSAVGAGVDYQWEVSPTGSGLDFTDVTGGSGSNTTSYTTGTLSPGTYYYRLRVTCSYVAGTGYSNELTLTVNALPAVSVNPSTGLFCTPEGIPVELTAAGADTYAWSPAAGLDATSGAVVHASPAATTTYTVTGTDGNGCTNTATAIITVESKPFVTAAATPDNICANANSQLLATAFVPSQVKDYSFNAGTGADLDPMAGATQVINSGIDDTPTALPENIGFTFKFDNVEYTQYSVSPDGWILLGGATAVSQFSNSITSTTNIPKIYPYWDDLATGTTGNVTTLVSGDAPNRIFIVQWYVTIPRATTGAANSTMQAWLYETTNVIEFRYGAMGSGLSASVGLSGNTPVTNFNCVTVSTGTNSTVTANNSNAVQPAVGTIYTFTPPAQPTVLWTPNTFLDFDNILNPLATGMTETTEYTVTATNGGCSSSASVTVTVGAPLSASATANPAVPICLGSEVTLTATPTGGGAPFTYSWKVDDVEVSTLESFQATPLLTTTYDLAITDDCGQTANASVTVVVKPVPTASASNDSPVCEGETVNLTGTTDFGVTFNWNGPDGYTSDQQNPVITSAPVTAAGVYSFTATFDGCTSDPATTEVIVNPLPSGLAITPPMVAVKAGTVQQLTATGAVFSTIMSQDFNGAPIGWTTVNNSTGGTPANAAWSLYLSSPTFQSNDNSIFVLSNSDGQGNGGTTRTQLISPEFNTTGYSGLTLSYWHYFRIYTSADIGKVEVSLDGGTTWEEEAAAIYTTTTGTATAWAPATIDLSGYIGQPSLKIRFNYYAEYGYYWGVDNVVVTGVKPVDFTWAPFTDLFTDDLATNAYNGEITPTVYTKPMANITYTVTATSEAGCTNTQTVDVFTCPEMPGTPTVNFISPNSFDLEWSYTFGTYPSSYTIDVATDDQFTMPVAGSPFTVAAPQNTFTVPGLEGNTLYYFRIRANDVCSSDYTPTVTVTTLCTPLVAPFVEDFENTGFAPLCWANEAVFGTFLWQGSTAASANGIGTASAMANFFDQSSGEYELRTLPFDISALTTPMLKFNYAYASYVVELDEMDVYYSTDYGKTWNILLLMPGGPNGILNTAGLDENAFVPTSTQWCTQSLLLPAGTNMVKFTAISAYGNNLYIDNITVSEPMAENNALQDITVTGNEAYYANNTITVAGGGTYFTVLSGGSVTLQAGEMISIQAGTTVLAGGYLLGFISKDVYCFPEPKQDIPATVGKEETLAGFEQAFFTLYPNPTNGNFTLVQKGSQLYGNVTVEIYSMRGERVMTDQMTGEVKREFNVAEIPAGLYFVKILAEDYTETIKLVKTR